jgi:geranylgeranyl diphosphate synthase type II
MRVKDLQDRNNIMYNQSELKKIVEKAIVNLSYDDETERLTDPVRYVLSMGGKRIRPVLCLMSLNLFNDHIDEGIIPAAGIEVFHNFTLVHDDIMDHAPVRRNLPTVHVKWNVNQAILSGDVMAFIANECMLQAPAGCLRNVFRDFNRAAVDVCMGQQLDMDYEKAAFISEDEYLRMIELKTASLLAAAARIGAVIGGAGERDAGLMHEVGRNIGLAFQMQDDLLDIYGDTKVFGKISGGDIVANKKTFLLVKAMELATGDQLKRLQELFSNETADPDAKVSEVLDIYNRLNVRSATENLANDYIRAAFSRLEQVNVRKERKEEIIQTATSLMGRDK